MASAQWLLPPTASPYVRGPIGPSAELLFSLRPCDLTPRCYINNNRISRKVCAVAHGSRVVGACEETKHMLGPLSF